ncbi:MAG TPA: prepilin peptidase [Candidatus Acidoferrum sp.]|nr:prepilin peptidase [Candidatus Acidoferrum sp.]
MIPTWLALAGCAVASYGDVRSRRIPNWLTGSLALAALAIHSFYGLRAAIISLLVMIVLTGAGTLVYSWGGIGGGDIKLAVAASGMVSYPLCVPFLLYSAIGGGLLAIGFILLRRAARGDNIPKSKTLPYAVAFLFGAVVLVLSQSVAPFLRISV